MSNVGVAAGIPHIRSNVTAERFSLLKIAYSPELALARLAGRVDPHRVAAPIRREKFRHFRWNVGSRCRGVHVEGRQRSGHPLRGRPHRFFLILSG